MARIALIASSFLPRMGGVEVHVANIATELVRLGHTVAIWAVDQGDEAPDDYRGIPVRYLPCPLPARTLPAAAGFLQQALPAWRAWHRALAADRPDVLNIQCFGPNGVYASTLARTTGVPLVYSHHGETSGDANDAFGSSALLRRALTRTLAGADAVTSCSAHAAADLARFGRDPSTVKVISNGIDMAEPLGSPPPGLPSQYLLGIGRLVANKGFANLIRAYAEARPAAGLVIGGEGPEMGRLRALAGDLDVDAHFTGRLSRPEVGALMAGADALIVPSLAEAFGITVLEGWRAGVPVVVTDRGGPPEFVTDQVTGLLVDPEDVHALAEHIRRLDTDPELRHRLGAAGHAAVTGFTWVGAARLYSKVFEAATSAA